MRYGILILWVHFMSLQQPQRLEEIETELDTSGSTTTGKGGRCTSLFTYDRQYSLLL